jgi:NTP pyrophosphatase (non-canonical NTP hydrolase)
MRRLQKNDGTERHLKVARYHSRRCRERGEDSLCKVLFDEIEQARQALRSKARNLEDIEDELTDLTADVDAAEIALEEQVRDIFDDFAKLDRKNPELGAHGKAFPKGLGGVINPEGESQLAAIASFRTRVSEFNAYPGVQHSIDALDVSIANFKQKLEAQKQGEERSAEAFTQEQLARTSVREQLNSAFSRLGDRYKSNPDYAERFFPKDARSGSTALSRAEERGRAQGKAESLLRLLESKKIPVPQEDKEKILGANDIDKQDLWFGRALSETNLAAILAE